MCLCDAGRCEGVVYIPGLSSEDTHRAIQQSFALVNSSNSEGMSLAILEVIPQLIFVFLPLNIYIMEDPDTSVLQSLSLVCNVNSFEINVRCVAG